MRNKMIWGRYIDTDSWLHHLDPRAKLMAMLLYLSIVLSIRSFADAGLVLLLSAVILYCTRIPFSYYVRAVKPLIFLIGFIFVFSVLMTWEGNLLISIGPLKIYEAGVTYGVLRALRLMLFVTFSAMLTFTTSPAKLLLALSHVLFPLKWIRISPQRISLMLSIALRFVPTLFDEAGKILKAQASRGADIKELPWREKAKVLMSLLVPVTVGAIRRAGDLVDSMHARGFILDAPRSQYHTLVWQAKDTLFLLTLAATMVLLIWFV